MCREGDHAKELIEERAMTRPDFYDTNGDIRLGTYAISLIAFVDIVVSEAGYLLTWVLEAKFFRCDVAKLLVRFIEAWVFANGSFLGRALCGELQR